MTEFADRYWMSRDGLKLHYRDYAGCDDRPPVICLHALTRNARDFESLAERISGDWRVICPEMRGRRESEYAKNAETYNPLQYVEDVTALLDELAIERFISVGTSLGGLMTFLLAAQSPARIAGALINDVGPYLEPAGLERIKSYVGQGRSFPTWVHAARALEEAQGLAHPRFELSDWIAMAKRVMTLSSNGRIVFDYDMKVGEPFATLDPNNQPDLWPALQGLAGKPALIVRGALSDLFSEATQERMVKALPEADFLTIGEVGHAPTLDEPEAVAAIDRFLDRFG